MTQVSLPPIITTQSAVKSWNACPRRRWWEFEAPNGSDTGTRGWERTRMAIPLSTGTWSHRIVQGLLQIASGCPISDRLSSGVGEGQAVPTTPLEVIQQAKDGYLAEVADRGLELGAQEPLEESWTATEQAALLEAFGWAFMRVRVPRLLDEFEVVSIEQEEFTLLSGDVGQASRADAILRRRSDGYLFVYNFKTAGNTSDSRWEQSFAVDMQLMTETLAVERRMGEKVWGVLIDAFDKGVRTKIDATTLREVRDVKEGQQTHEAQRCRLIYGYKTDPNPPIQPALYDWEGTTKKGWFRFAVWQNDFNDAGKAAVGQMSPVEWWVNWLPVEVIEAQFKTLEPITRDERAVERKVEQIVAIEQGIRDAREKMDAFAKGATVAIHGQLQSVIGPYALERYFPQNERSCFYPSRCSMYAMCWEPGVADDPQGSGLYRPRTANHPIEGGE